MSKKFKEFKEFKKAQKCPEMSKNVQKTFKKVQNCPNCPKKLKNVQKIILTIPGGNWWKLLEGKEENPDLSNPFGMELCLRFDQHLSPLFPGFPGGLALKLPEVVENAKVDCFGMVSWGQLRHFQRLKLVWWEKYLEFYRWICGDFGEFFPGNVDFSSWLEK